MKEVIEKVGAAIVLGIERLGFAVRLFLDSIYWLIFGRFYKQTQIREENIKLIELWKFH